MKEEGELGYIYPGSIFGALSCMSGKTRYYTVIAESFLVTVLSINRGKFFDLMAEYPELEKTFCQYVTFTVLTELSDKYHNVESSKIMGYIDQGKLIHVKRGESPLLNGYYVLLSGALLTQVEENKDYIKIEVLLLLI